MATVGFTMTSKPPGKPLALLTSEQREGLLRQEVSRRRLLQQPGRAAAAVTGGLMAAGAAPVAGQEATPAVPHDHVEFTGVPPTPLEVPPAEFVTLTPEEAAILEALVSRMLPGDEDDPGALETGVAYYIDNLLSENGGYREPIYRSGPWARPYEGDTPPPEEEGIVWVPASELGRYGLQSPLTPLDVYRIGLELTNQHAIERYGQAVAQLEPEDQDNVMWDLMRGDIDGFDQFSSFSFFQTLRLHTAEGMFSDPGYGGNRDLAGWKLVGFPGAQRAYLPQEIRGTGDPRPPQSMADMPHFHTGENEDVPNLVLPVRGTEDEEGEEDDEDGDDGGG